MVMRVPGPKKPEAETLLSDATSVTSEWFGIPTTIVPNGIKPRDPTLPLDCELFALTNVGALHWLAMDGWTIDEAALLLSGANPKHIQMFGADPNVPRPDLSSCGHIGHVDRLKRATEMGILQFPAPPLRILEWADSKCIVVPAGLFRASSAVSDQPTATSGAPKRAAPVLPEKQPITGVDRDEMTGMVRRMRAALIKELSGVWPSIERDLSDNRRNGLSVAKLQVHGFWDMNKAVKWASERGKITKQKAEQSIATNPGSVFAATLKQIFNM